MADRSRMFSAVLVVILILTSFPVSAKGNEEETRFWLASDTHFVPAADCEDINSIQNAPWSELYHHTTTQGQMNHESEAIIREFLTRFEKSDSEYLLISGDLTNGKINSHKVFAALLKETEERSGKKIFVTPGNHDIFRENDADRATVDVYKDIYNDFGFSEAVETDEKSCSYTVDLDGNYRLISFDSCEYGEDNGNITKERQAWLKSQLDKAFSAGKEVILMLHHSVIKHYALQNMMKVQGSAAGAFASFLADKGVKYVLTGHIHANDISRKKTVKGNEIYDIMTGSLITSPNSYRIVTLAGRSADIKTESIDKIDTSYLPSGFNSAQLDAIENDFSAYARGFLVEGMSYWIGRNIGGPRLAAKLLGIKSGTAAYEKLGEIMSVFGEAASLPIYGSAGSLQAVAAKAGQKIDESEYQYIYQIIGSVVATFFSGEDVSDSHSSDVKLLLKCLKAAISYSSAKFTSRLLGEKAFDIALPVSAVWTYFIFMFDGLLVRIAMPLLRGIINDYSEPSDLCTTVK